jgi:hypothetical protein
LLHLCVVKVLEMFWAQVPQRHMSEGRLQVTSYEHLITRACRKTPLRVMGCLLASLLPLYRNRFL